MNIPFLHLRAQYEEIQPDIDKAVLATVQSQQFVLGAQVEQCEALIAKYSGARYGCGVSSGTDALLISLMAQGIGPGDEVITTPYTFFATAGSIARVGATPVFVDIDAVTYNLNTEDIRSCISEHTKAIVVVHLFGQMVDMNPVLALAKEYNLVIIEDAAQAIGAEYRGCRAGSMGDFGCFSFYPSKNLGAAGDGGMVVVNDKKKAQRLKEFRSHGAHKKYFHDNIGGNFRLDAIQAAVVTAKLPYLDSWIEKRQNNAAQYHQLLADVPHITTPEQRQDRHTYNSYVIRAKHRDALREHLAKHGVQTQIYYPLPLHLQPCFSYLGYTEGDFPVSEQAAQEALALPIYPEMNLAMQEYVAETVRSFYTKASN